MANIDKKICSTPLINREMKIKSTLRYYLSCGKWHQEEVGRADGEIKTFGHC
jgi:hypothetical protein